MCGFKLKRYRLSAPITLPPELSDLMQREQGVRALMVQRMAKPTCLVLVLRTCTVLEYENAAMQL